ncbi:MAG: SRPBCC family protein, partial [Myxococcota bacterium]
YHAWTYGLDGALTHVPLAQAFPGLPQADRGLSEVACSERHGLVWVTLDPDTPHDVDTFLGPLGDELAALGLDQHVVYRRTARRCAANWKFLADAFLENYHVRRLHRQSVGGFFVDSVSVFDSVGPHMRTATARKSLLDPPPEAPPSSLMTMSYHIAPWTMLIVHPGFISRLSLLPRAVDEMDFVHEMLIPRADDTPERAEHWRRSFELIDGGVFQGEDIMIAERSQVGLSAGANDALLFGALEAPAVAFHAALRRMLASPDAALDAAHFEALATR